ncbi:MAG: DUF4136 domain-containing protein [Verrucomicrobiota bacterium]
MKTSALSVLHLTAVALTAALALAGCSSTPPLQVDAGPIRAGTFNFVNNKSSALAQREERRQAVHGMIQSAITENLTAKGFQKVNGQADVAVAYLVVVGNGAATVVFDDYFGLGRESAEIGAKAHDVSTQAIGGPNYSEAGLLVIDLLDPATAKLLKRTSVVRPVLRNAPAEIRQEHLQEAVTQALQSLQVSK